MADSVTDLVSIDEFRRLSGLSAEDVLTLLANGELDVTLGSLGEVRVDLCELTPEKLAKLSPEKKQGEKDDPLLTEAIASELVAAIDPILDEALELAFTWQKNKS